MMLFRELEDLTDFIAEIPLDFDGSLCVLSVTISLGLNDDESSDLWDLLLAFEFNDLIESKLFSVGNPVTKLTLIVLP